MNLRSLSVADSGRLARPTQLINKIETEGRRCVAWPLSVIKTHSLNSSLHTKPHIIQLLPSANTIQRRRDELRRVKMRYYNKGDVVYMVIALTRIEWVRSSLQKLLPWTKGLFINLKSLLRFLQHNENIPLNGTNSLLLFDKHIEITRIWQNKWINIQTCKKLYSYQPSVKITKYNFNVWSLGLMLLSSLVKTPGWYR